MSYKELIWKLATKTKLSSKEENEVKRIVVEVNEINNSTKNKNKTKNKRITEE